MNKYVVYYEALNTTADSTCNHILKEFDDLTVAFLYYQRLKDGGTYKNIHILKNLAVKVVVTEIDYSHDDDWKATI